MVDQVRPRRCETEIVGLQGECLACGADQGASCGNPRRSSRAASPGGRGRNAVLLPEGQTEVVMQAGKGSASLTHQRPLSVTLSDMVSANTLKSLKEGDHT